MPITQAAQGSTKAQGHVIATSPVPHNKRNQKLLTSFEAQVGDENNTLQAARSRILDVNYASEAANMTRLQMQQQVGIASLSQAKNIPSNFMSLLN